MRRSSLLLAYAVLAGAPLFAQERLILIGGGPRPAEALARLVDWAGGHESRILVVTWAARDPQQAFESFRHDLEPHRPGAVQAAPPAPLDADGKARLREQLAWATGIFFSGGDQRRIMDVLRDRSLLEHVRARYEEGTVFAGTSAGTACMSAIMIIGDGDYTVIDGDEVEVSVGMGLLPGVILDQHFIRRQREHRLFGLVLKHPGLLGVGVDEATALLVRDNRYAEVVGASRVVTVEAVDGGTQMRLHLLEPGESFDLKERKRSRLARLGAS